MRFLAGRFAGAGAAVFDDAAAFVSSAVSGADDSGAAAGAAGVFAAFRAFFLLLARGSGAASATAAGAGTGCSARFFVLRAAVGRSAFLARAADLRAGAAVFFGAFSFAVRVVRAGFAGLVLDAGLAVFAVLDAVAVRAVFVLLDVAFFRADVAFVRVAGLRARAAEVFLAAVFRAGAAFFAAAFLGAAFFADADFFAGAAFFVVFTAGFLTDAFLVAVFLVAVFLLAVLRDAFFGAARFVVTFRAMLFRDDDFLAGPVPERTALFRPADFRVDRPVPVDFLTAGFPIFRAIFLRFGVFDAALRAVDLRVVAFRVLTAFFVVAFFVFFVADFRVDFAAGRFPDTAFAGAAFFRTLFFFFAGADFRATFFLDAVFPEAEGFFFADLDADFFRVVKIHLPRSGYAATARAGCRDVCRPQAAGPVVIDSRRNDKRPPTRSSRCGSGRCGGFARRNAA